MDYDLLYEVIYDAEMDIVLRVVLIMMILLFGSSGTIVVVIKWFQNKMERRILEQQKILSENKVERQMLLGMAHNTLSYLCKKHIKNGYITIEEYKNVVKYLYNPYKKLDGNDEIDKLVEEVKKLKIVQCDIFRVEEGRGRTKPGQRLLHENTSFD